MLQAGSRRTSRPPEVPGSQRARAVDPAVQTRLNHACLTPGVYAAPARYRRPGRNSGPDGRDFSDTPIQPALRAGSHGYQVLDYRIAGYLLAVRGTYSRGRLLVPVPLQEI